MYLVKKVFLQADEQCLTQLAQLCIEEAVGEKICQERPGICSIQRKACEDILNQEFEQMCAPGNVFGKLRAAVLRRRLESSSAEKKTGRQRLPGGKKSSGAYGRSGRRSRCREHHGSDPTGG